MKKDPGDLMSVNAPERLGVAATAAAVPPGTSTVGMAATRSAEAGVAGNSRSQGLDFAKGLLVLFMVLYHWINYFVAVDGYIYRYIRFITPSFIFITGFLVSHVYLAKYDLRDARLPRRLIGRGAKLLALFTVLNVAAGLAVSRNYDGETLGVKAFIGNLVSVYAIGDGRSAVFQVLVPISYLLLLCGLLLLVRRGFAFSFYGVCAAMFGGALMLDLCGFVNGSLGLIGIGFLGVCLGRIGSERLGEWGKRWLALLAAYAGYLTAVTVWDVLYPLQVVGVCLSLMLCYAIGSKWRGQGWVLTRILLLGRYTLLAYITQIVVLQLLIRGLRFSGHEWVRVVLALVLTTAVTQLTVELVERVRARSKSADRAYRVVFA